MAPIDTPRTLTSAEMCDLFGVSKTTLFRWEAQHEWFPPVARDANRQRIYTAEHVKAASEFLKARLAQVYTNTSQALGAAELRGADLGLAQARSAAVAFQRELSLRKVIVGDMTGVHELAEGLEPVPGLVQKMLQILLDYHSPTSAFFVQTLEVILDICKQQQERTGDGDQ